MGTPPWVAFNIQWSSGCAIICKYNTLPEILRVLAAFDSETKKIRSEIVEWRVITD